MFDLIPRLGNLNDTPTVNVVGGKPITTIKDNPIKDSPNYVYAPPVILQCLVTN